MAGVPDKARYYLELSVPQLREFEAKSIFTPEEIRALVRKRSDFEHLVLSPGNRPAEWLSYAAWERSLETLRAKRCRRMQIRTSSAYVGQGRIFGIFERAVGRHPGSLEPWTEYLRFAASVKATRRWRKIMSRALRMHPARPELWVLAGRRSASHGDMQAARDFFMRGARFCRRDAALWLEYARCELEWLGRMEAKKGKAGGATRALEEQAEKDDGNIEFADGESQDEEDEDGRLILPDPEDAAKKVSGESAVQKLETNPALDGAIPLAIFDMAKKQQFYSVAVAEQFFDLFATFNVSCRARLVHHVVDSMTEQDADAPPTCDCFVREPMVRSDPNTALYVGALREALARLKTALSKTTDKSRLAQKTRAWIDPILSSDGLDPGIRAVLDHTVRTLPQP